MDREKVIEKLERGYASERIMGRHNVSKRQLGAIKAAYFRAHGKKNSMAAYDLIEKGLPSDEIAAATGLSKSSVDAYRACYTMCNRPGGKWGKGKKTLSVPTEYEDTMKIYEDIEKGVSDEKMMKTYKLSPRSLGAFKAHNTRRKD